jgi:hypothetical protein
MWMPYVHICWLDQVAGREGDSEWRMYIYPLAEMSDGQWIIQRCMQQWKKPPEVRIAELIYQDFPTPEGVMTRSEMVGRSLGSRRSGASGR